MMNVVREWYRSLRPVIDTAKDLTVQILGVKLHPSYWDDDDARSPKSTKFIPFFIVDNFRIKFRVIPFTAAFR
jgi:hypothetical protein